MSLELAAAAPGIETVQTLVILAGLAVGGVVVYQAVRGYRRNDSRAMLLLAVGLGLLGPVHFLLALPPLASLPLAVVGELLDVTGLLVVLYSLTRA